MLNEADGKALGVEIDIEIDQEIAKQADITGTPTIHLFKQKELKHQWKGVKQRSQFKEALDKLFFED